MHQPVDVDVVEVPEPDFMDPECVPVIADCVIIAVQYLRNGCDPTTLAAAFSFATTLVEQELEESRDFVAEHYRHKPKRRGKPKPGTVHYDA